ncbi:MAG: biosynthetic-type acetolactate synthase large subunit [Lachnospiraceae bacterium]|jgi:acetolactate synthase-1/2/3 large subunit|nr:biosynthetic-type acetolactate synthase large subunit [Lachnospiraceae bacterium]MCR4803944.1 biosynthetic-type acetolactate synthase large subunit [Lachnospiraceae bacterium]
MAMKGTELFVKALVEEGVDTLFGYPGGQAIDLFDALYDQTDINVILPRHEQALIHAAEGYAKSTGKVGVCLVTSGPGATNLVTGIADANYDSIPLVCFTGQVPLNLMGNDAFQEIDIVGVTRGICKWAVTVRDREELPQIIKKAFYIAKTGKPGPVLIDFPKDIQKAMGTEEYPTTVSIRGYKPNESVHIKQIKKAVQLLQNAKNPLFLIGGGVNIARANEAMEKLVDETKIPLVTTIMGKGAISTTHELYLGNLGIHGSYAANHAVTECDLLFSIGTRFNDRITGKISEFAKNATIVHIDIDAASISKNIQVDVPIVADAKMAIEAILEVLSKKTIEVPYVSEREAWNKKLTDWKKKYPIHMKSATGLTPEKVIQAVNKRYKNSVITTDVGQNQLWATQYVEIDKNRQLLTSGGLGTMGFGFPAAIGAQIGNPDKKVICFSGDGGFQMNIQEMATAVVQELPLLLIIFNNNYLGNVRQWQELYFNKRYSSTCLRWRKSAGTYEVENDKDYPKYTPDFIKLADSYDAAGIRITTEAEIEEALNFADSRKNGPTIIEVMIDPTLNVWPMVPAGNTLDDMILDC